MCVGETTSRGAESAAKEKLAYIVMAVCKQMDVDLARLGAARSVVRGSQSSQSCGKDEREHIIILPRCPGIFFLQKKKVTAVKKNAAAAAPPPRPRRPLCYR